MAIQRFGARIILGAYKSLPFPVMVLELMYFHCYAMERGLARFKKKKVFHCGENKYRIVTIAEC